MNANNIRPFITNVICRKKLAVHIIQFICVTILLFELSRILLRKQHTLDNYTSAPNKQISIRDVSKESQRPHVRPTNSSSNQIFQIRVYGIVREVKVKDDGSWQLLFDFEGNHEFRSCQYRNCTCTTNHAAADVVIVETMALDWNLLSPPLPRLKGQIWIAYTLEPPPIMRTLPWQRLEKQFHLTASYQSTSDIFCPYGSSKLKHPSTKGRSDILNDLHSKNKILAWFVSNCKGQSQRRRYVDELQKHIPVDIFGSCGNLTCPKMTNDGQYNDNNCRQLLRTTYKFYLAFESSLCLDYVTEKVWLNMGIVVPIVMGFSNYTRFMPPHSFIDVQDFPSAKALADYLYVLDKNPEMYAKYFDWTKDYDATYGNPDVYWACQICKYLHTHKFSEDFLAHPKVSLEDLTNTSHACLSPDDFFAGIL